MEIKGLELSDKIYPIEQIIRLILNGTICSGARIEVFFKDDKMFYKLNCIIAKENEVAIRGLGLMPRQP